MDYHKDNILNTPVCPDKCVSPALTPGPSPKGRGEKRVDVILPMVGRGCKRPGMGKQGRRAEGGYAGKAEGPSRRLTTRTYSAPRNKMLLAM